MIWLPSGESCGVPDALPLEVVRERNPVGRLRLQGYSDSDDQDGGEGVTHGVPPLGDYRVSVDIRDAGW